MFPSNAAERKTYPVASGVLKYFPRAIAAVSHVSYLGNQQHHPNEPLHWDMSKSSDEPDALLRHAMTALANPMAADVDGSLEIAKVAWRALAWCERVLAAAEIEMTEPEQPTATYPSRVHPMSLTARSARKLEQEWKDRLRSTDGPVF